jgi:hypothetical protein
VSAVVEDQRTLPRGIKLKTVSRFILVFALVCLAAFAAGRPPASLAGSFGATGQGTMMREGCFASSGSGKREPRKLRKARERGRPLVSCFAMRSRKTSS